MDLLIVALIVLTIAALGAAALWIGVDSREGSDDPRRSSYPVGID